MLDKAWSGTGQGEDRYWTGRGQELDRARQGLDKAGVWRTGRDSCVYSIAKYTRRSVKRKDRRGG